MAIWIRTPSLANKQFKDDVRKDAGIFWIRTEYGEIRSTCSYSMQMREHTDTNNFEYGHFLPSGMK